MRFTALELLWQGPSTAVYKAHDPSVDRFVALKVLERRSPAATERLQREARAQARISSPHLCEIYEVGEADGKPYIAMEFITGPDLAAAAREMPLRERIAALAKVARALEEMHRLGLVHRDLKPANILLERRAGVWHPRLIDFGIVHEMGEVGATRTGQVLGTPCYMAPEQAAGERGTIDRRTDVYGLGATLYELATGQPPFAGSSGMETLLKVLDEEPRPPSAIDPSLAGKLEAIILKCLAKEPARRYASALALAEDLERWLGGEPVVARRDPTGWWRRLPRRHRSAAAVLLGAALLLAGCTAVFLRELGSRTSSGRKAQLLAEQAARFNWQVRTAHSRPRHDIRYVKREIEREAAAIARDLPTLTEPARSAAHFALGRGNFELLKLEPAREHLEAAWKGGMRNAELAFLLVRTLSHQYASELASLSGLPVERREARRREVERTILEPALSYLTSSHDLEPAVADYLRATLLLREQHYDAALARVQNAIETVPWLYEAPALAGVIYFHHALAELEGGRLEAAREVLTDARRAFENAITAAPSSPLPYSGLCGVETIELQLRVVEDRPTLLGDVEVVSCRQALEIDPERAQPYLWLARLETGLATYADWQGKPSSAEREKAISWARRAVRAEPTNLGITIELGWMLIHAALTPQGEDPLRIEEGLAEAAALFGRTLEQRPVDGSLGLGTVGMARGLLHSSHGSADPRPDFEQALVWLERAAQADPDGQLALLHLGLTRTLSCQAFIALGGPADAACEAAVAELERAAAANSSQVVAEAHLAGALSLAAELAALRGEESPRAERALALWKKLRGSGAAEQEIALRLAGSALSRGLLALARGEEARGPLRESRSHFRRAVRLSPHNDFAWDAWLGLELTAVDAELARGGTGRAALDRAREVYRRLKAVDKHRFAEQQGPFLALAEAEVLAAAVGRGGSRGQAREAAQRALELAERAAAARPFAPAYQCVKGGALALVAALAADTAARQGPAANAVSELSACLTRNPLLAVHYHRALENARCWSNPLQSDPVGGP